MKKEKKLSKAYCIKQIVKKFIANPFMKKWSYSDNRRRVLVSTTQWTFLKQIENKLIFANIAFEFKTWFCDDLAANAKFVYVVEVENEEIKEMYPANLVDGTVILKLGNDYCEREKP